jgi:small subunit ribosomal protein S4
MKLGPKYKICKRLGAGVFEKCQTQKFALSEARNPRIKKGGMRSGGSNFGVQLIEKQKARFTYGISERQFFRYVKEAMERKGGDSTRDLVSRLEARLDNVVYRAGFAATRRQARQMVAHGHFTVNGTRSTIPSHKVEKGDTIALRDGSRTSPIFANYKEKAAERTLPNWLKANEADALSVVVAGNPELASTEMQFDPAVIIQFYSR